MLQSSLEASNTIFKSSLKISKATAVYWCIILTLESLLFVISLVFCYIFGED
jgi:hypothetical protein